jgi:hypothetical protein
LEIQKKNPEIQTKITFQFSSKKSFNMSYSKSKQKCRKSKQKSRKCTQK